MAPPHKLKAFLAAAHGSMDSWNGTSTGPVINGDPLREKFWLGPVGKCVELETQVRIRAQVRTFLFN